MLLIKLITISLIGFPRLCTGAIEKRSAKKSSSLAVFETSRLSLHFTSPVFSFFTAFLCIIFLETPLILFFFLSCMPFLVSLFFSILVLSVLLCCDCIACGLDISRYRFCFEILVAYKR